MMNMTRNVNNYRYIGEIFLSLSPSIVKLRSFKVELDFVVFINLATDCVNLYLLCTNFSLNHANIFLRNKSIIITVY